MASKYLSGLNAEARNALEVKLHHIQNGICFICQKPIDLELDAGAINIDHIIPLAHKNSKDNEENFAITHESCNKSKQDADLNIARILHRLKDIQERIMDKEDRVASLKDVLVSYQGGKHPFQFKITEEGKVKFSFSKIGDTNHYETELFIDPLSEEKTVFINVPIEFIHHDELINPRGLNSSISKLVKEFSKGNPQLHLSLARMDEGKLKIFDGQHKAVAQILLGTKKLPLRIFIEPKVDRLIETNTNAGSNLRQIAFDKSIMRQLSDRLYNERIERYQQEHGLTPDDLSFSEQDLVNYFKGEINMKKIVIDTLKNAITFDKDSKLKNYIDTGGRDKELPISYSAFDKTFLHHFVDSSTMLTTPIGAQGENNPRELEISQIVQLLNIVADELFVDQFNPEVGVNRIEKKVADSNDAEIQDNHLRAYRMSKEEILHIWLAYVKEVIKNYFSNTGVMVNNDKTLFQKRFDEQLWTNIRNFIRNLKELPLWKDRAMSKTVFSGKTPYETWRMIFATGKTPDGALVLAKPVNFIEMIQPRT